MNRRTVTFVPLATLLAILVAFLVRGDNESLAAPPNSAPAPEAAWSFENEAADLSAQGEVLWNQPGPRAPEFPQFPTDNRAVRLGGKGYLVVRPGPARPALKRTGGEAITLEAWVRLDGLKDNQPMYVIGKGRTGSPKFARDNQNWAMRIVGERGIAKLSFLFATKPSAGSDHWSRWTSVGGFRASTGWHYVAIAYQFGKPATMAGWIDGQHTDGVWDLGGPTSKPPVVDDDAVWIGSASNGNPGNSFRGWLDEIRIHDQRLSNEVIASRFQRLNGPQVVFPLPEKMPALDVPPGQVLFTCSEGPPANHRWQLAGDPEPREVSRWTHQAFLLPRIPKRYDEQGLRDAWKGPVLIRIGGDVPMPAGDHELLVRARSLGRLWVDGKIVARTKAITHQPPNGEEPVEPVPQPRLPGMRLAGYHQQEVVQTWSSPKDQTVRVVLECIVGGKDRRPESGEVCVAVRHAGAAVFQVLTTDGQPLPLTDASIEPLTNQMEFALSGLEDETRREAAFSQDSYWKKRRLAASEWAQRNPPPPPPSSDTPQSHPIDRFLAAKLAGSKNAPPQAKVVDDATFVRRAYLDTLGVPPTAPEVRTFLADTKTTKRDNLIDRLLRDDRCADHTISMWLDLLAENPTLLNASLNSTGPFRWFLHDSLRDEKPLDRIFTELILMTGDPHAGGTAGFAMAAENDSPFAAKGHVLASALLGIELQCARCHDSPYHETTQQDLYSLAAMLARKPVSVPGTSSVPDAFFEEKARESLIEVTLAPGKPVSPTWPFTEVTGIEDSPELDALLRQPKDTRERLALLITSPQNQRFAEVFVNRLWKRLMGAGLVEPAHDWEGQTASHPDLLKWLAHQFVACNYQPRQIQRLIMTSQAYQREAIGTNLDALPAARWFHAPDPRRLTAEQIVDSLHHVTGRPMDVEELTFVHDGRRPLSNRQTLGKPSRAWMFASLNNERDRPSLSLPRARVVADVLEAFGWTGSRQKPINHRDTEPNLLQPGVLANGALTLSLTRAARDSELAQRAVDAASPEALVEHLFLRILNRQPSESESKPFVAALGHGFAERLVPENQIQPDKPLPPLPKVTWFNHQQSKANTIQQELERRVRQGPAADPRLRNAWREVYEDVVWSLINHREFVWLP